MWVLLNIITVLLYSSAAAIQYGALLKPSTKSSKALMLVVGITAVFVHALMLHHLIDLSTGQNLSTINLFSLVTWLIALLMIALAMFKPMENLSLFIFPLAGLSIILAFTLPGQHLIKTADDPRELVHIILSVLSFSVLVLAAIQASLLAMQQQKLRLKQTHGIWSKLPALETMEAILFQLIMLGFMLLTVLLVTSFYFYHDVLWHRFLDKAILACSAWLVFASLLLGRQFFGWRGKKAVWCTLGGIGLLTLTYFSTYMILGMMS